MSDKVTREEMLEPVYQFYQFQCMQCFIVSGHMSHYSDGTPSCCGGEMMGAIRICDFGKEKP